MKTSLVQDLNAHHLRRSPSISFEFVTTTKTILFKEFNLTEFDRNISLRDFGTYSEF